MAIISRSNIYSDSLRNLSEEIRFDSDTHPFGAQFTLKVGATGIQEMEEALELLKDTKEKYKEVREERRKKYEEASYVFMKVDEGLEVYSVNKDRFGSFGEVELISEAIVMKFLSDTESAVLVLDSSEDVLAKNFL